ncbi:MAG: biotin--[acetyl-CoA-carboxylase] ligase [Treponema sp.]|jgi:BirA family biotin operon repressor/biotin-[acetyl-CoA-carboxylase] ligase|nr:biotin--[acetyl-CoA-carboxylase] ligase [Treponema sp.]
MRTIPVANAFEGPVYFEMTVSSTMDLSRRLADAGAPHGTVVCADFQEAGRGRTGGRPWLGDAGDNLFFTLLLRYGSFASIPAVLTLRTGLAVSRAVEDLAPPLAGRVRIKWPNDVLILLPGGGRKIAGILSETDGGAVFIGVGVNLRQREFPPELRNKATSLTLSLRELGLEQTGAPDTGRPDTARDPRFALLELILKRLHAEIDAPGQDAARAPDRAWRERLEERLYMRGERVRFIAGGADSGRAVEGTLGGIGPGGELLIRCPDDGVERAFITGELDLRSPCG